MTIKRITSRERVVSSDGGIQKKYLLHRTTLVDLIKSETMRDGNVLLQYIERGGSGREKRMGGQINQEGSESTNHKTGKFQIRDSYKGLLRDMEVRGSKKETKKKEIRISKFEAEEGQKMRIMSGGGGQ